MVTIRHHGVKGASIVMKHIPIIHIHLVELGKIFLGQGWHGPYQCRIATQKWQLTMALFL